MAYVAFAQSSRTLRGRVYPAHGFALRRSGTRPELRAAYEALAAVVSPFCVDGEIVTKTFGQPYMGTLNSNVPTELGPA
jgi:hypothetical protein